MRAGLVSRFAGRENISPAHISPVFLRLPAMSSRSCAPSIQLPPADGRSADLVVFSATPGGIAAACSAAEEGLAVILLATSRQVGGHLSRGVCTAEIEHILPESFSDWMLRFLRRIGRYYSIEGPLHRWNRLWLRCSLPRCWKKIRSGSCQTSLWHRWR